MWGLVAVVTCPWARGPCRVPPGGGLSGGRLQLVQEVVQGWDAFLQAFALACLRHHLTGAAGDKVFSKDVELIHTPTSNVQHRGFSHP